MQKIKKNEIINKQSLFLLKKIDNRRSKKSNKSNYYSYLRNESVMKNNSIKKLLSFRNKSFLNKSKFQSNLLNIGNISKIENKSNKSNKSNNSYIMTSYPSKKSKTNKMNLKVLKKLFPNISELSIYSNFPLYPFENNDKAYNSHHIIKNESKKVNLKKNIFEFYIKNIFRQDYQNKLSKRIIFNDDIEEKNKSYGKYFNKTNLNNLNYIKRTREENSKSSNKNIHSNLDDNYPLKITNFKYYNNNNINNSNNRSNANKDNKDNKKSKLVKVNKKSLNDIFKNKEINKYFNSEKIFPIINSKKENNYKYIKILKNIKEKNECFTSDNKINYNFSPQNNNIQSILSRNNRKLYEELNKKKYEEKGTDTSQDN
jgi:hypothetical protein